MRLLPEIIEAAGGPKAIEEASGGSIRRDAVYKWPIIGVRDRHWHILIELAGACPEELYRANLVARDQICADRVGAAE